MGIGRRPRSLLPVRALVEPRIRRKARIGHPLVRLIHRTAIAENVLSKGYVTPVILWTLFSVVSRFSQGALFSHRPPPLFLVRVVSRTTTVGGVFRAADPSASRLSSAPSLG